jgi:hypothetical protein
MMKQRFISRAVKLKSCVWILLLIVPTWLFSQQVADTTYHPDIPDPAYKQGTGPVIFIDEGHFNFHTRDGRYRAFAMLLERDGYVVSGYQGQFEKNRLSEGEILVISNALNEANVNDWYLPTPSAFTESEIKTVKKWVKRGGNLFLIADHMPMAGAAMELAAAFGFGFTNGFAVDTIARGPAFFNREDATLGENILTNGRDPSERVDQIVSFTGQAFSIPRDAVPVLTFGKNFLNLLPDTAWVFDERTTIDNLEGWSQGAYKKFGRGRVAVFGEAAMFTAQLAGPDQIKMGMNNEIAPENYKLLLNIIHWLDGKIE